MYICISQNTTLSSSGLIAYLEKEESMSDRFVRYFDKDGGSSLFFNEKSNISGEEVVEKMFNLLQNFNSIIGETPV